MATCEGQRGVVKGALAAALIVLVVSLPAVAQGALLSADTQYAMPGWFSTLAVQFQETSPNKSVDGSIDYAVYAPGQFQLSFPNKDPSNGTQYVYRFQLYNNTGLNRDYMKKLTIGLVSVSSVTGWFCTSVEPNDPYATGGVAPASNQMTFNGPPYTSVSWGFKSSGSGYVQPGSFSKMLIFTSPYGPTMQSATINSQSTAEHWELGGVQHENWHGYLPSPGVPEPATLSSLLVAGGLFVVYRVLRRK